MNKILLISLSILITLSYSQTDVSGEVSGIWNIEGSPYLVSDDLVISPYTALTIDAGVEVIFLSNNKITVNGELHANGAQDSNIIFLSSEEDGSWQGIDFSYSTGASNLNFCDITSTNDKAVSTYYSQNVSIADTHIHSFEGYAVYSNDTFANVTIANTVIEDGGAQTYIYAEDTYLFLDHVTLAGSSDRGIAYSGSASLSMDYC